MTRKQNVYWLSDVEWEAIQPHLRQGRRGARRVDDRRVISGIMHMLRSGGRWKDCPAVYGPYTTISNRWNRWSRQGVWEQIFYARPARPACSPARWIPPISRPIARRPAPKALLAIRCPTHKLLADRAYDATSLRDWLAERGTEPVIPPNPPRKHPHAYNRDAYRGRNLIERMFCRLKDFRRIATARSGSTGNDFMKDMDASRLRLSGKRLSFPDG